ncbi:unnamed protein product [Brugia timori]|uniref:AA_permease domain-containing protein n=1 Tax=Brugia timori TaxID=42155 RepID=A0A3P7Y1W0_9BILA|nr:unnamed protein product [Brugia timori]
MYVAARQGHLPTFLSCSNTEHNSPRVAIFISVTLSFLLSFTGNLSQLINCVSFCQWLQRIFTMLALLWIRFHHKSIHRDAIQNPIIMPIIFMIICATLVTTTVITDTHICSIGGSVALGGLVFYFLFFYTHLPSAVEGFKTFGCNANNKITIYTQIVFNVMPPEFSEEITRTCQVNLSPTPEASGNTDSITNSEGGNNAVQVF